MTTKTIALFHRRRHSAAVLLAVLGLTAATARANDETTQARPNSGREGDGEILGLPTSNDDGTILGVLPAPSRTVKAGAANESYIAEELVDGKVDPGVDNIFEADQQAVGAPPTSQRETGASKFVPPPDQQNRQQTQPSSAAAANAGVKTSFNELPDPVQKSLRASAGSANLEHIQKIAKGDETCYRATFDKNGMKGQVTVGQDGSLIRSQQAVDFALIEAVPAVSQNEMKMDSLPAEVKTAIQEAAGSAKVGGLSKSTESGQTLYHAAFNEAGVHTELLLGEDGNLLARTDQSALFIAPLVSPRKVTLQSVPDPVRQTVREHSGESQPVADLDIGTWNGQTAYKVTIQKDGLPRHLVISESGQLLGDRSQAAGAPAASESSSDRQTSPDQKSSSDQPSSKDQQQNK